MKRKLMFSVLLALCLIGLAGCGGTGNSEPADGQSVQSVQSVEPEQTQEPGQNETPVQLPEAEAGGVDPAVALERANAYMDQYYSMFSKRQKGTVELVGMRQDGEYCDCLFNHAEVIGEGGLLTINWRFHVIYRMLDSGWSSGTWDSTMRVYTYDWKLVGEWTGENEGKQFWLNIHSYDMEAGTVEVEYDFGGNEVSNGVVTMYIVNQDYWDQEQKEWSLNTDKSADYGLIDIYPYGANYSDAGEGVGLLADDGDTHCWLTRN